MDDQNKNLLLATSLSFLVLLGWMLMFPPEPIEEVPSEQTREQVTRERGETGVGLSTPVQADNNQKSQKNEGKGHGSAYSVKFLSPTFMLADIPGNINGLFVSMLMTPLKAPGP